MSAGRAVFIPWGTDSVLQTQDDKSLGRPEGYVFAELLRRLSRLPQVAQRLSTELQRLLEEVWDEPALLASVEEYAAHIRRAERSEGYELALDAQRDWIRSRRQQLFSMWAGGLPGGLGATQSCFKIGLGNKLAVIQDVADWHTAITLLF